MAGQLVAVIDDQGGGFESAKEKPLRRGVQKYRIT